MLFPHSLFRITPPIYECTHSGDATRRRKTGRLKCLFWRINLFIADLYYFAMRGTSLLGHKEQLNYNLKWFCSYLIHQIGNEKNSSICSLAVLILFLEEVISLRTIKMEKVLNLPEHLFSVDKFNNRPLIDHVSPPSNVWTGWTNTKGLLDGNDNELVSHWSPSSWKYKYLKFFSLVPVWWSIPINNQLV